MASTTFKFMAPILLIIILCYIAPSSLAAEYRVGDDLGWRPLVNYYSWVRSKSIQLGDTLVFNYDASQYSVAEVTQFKFIACNASDAIFFEKDGQSSITLSRPGQHYFMADNHCADQMVFSVLV
ncbi:Plastocyanin-like protein [Corchorus olitorius]|uniref:Plastocyanin-like protein n=1 Tax=Corchorus olitorius TaxID=93759 RepID=A0A1R3HCS8_9ROSI|nr:Plastocyanin-like protein [Corchorus olitorius]